MNLLSREMAISVGALPAPMLPVTPSASSRVSAPVVDRVAGDRAARRVGRVGEAAAVGDRDPAGRRLRRRDGRADHRPRVACAAYDETALAFGRAAERFGDDERSAIREREPERSDAAAAAVTVGPCATPLASTEYVLRRLVFFSVTTSSVPLGSEGDFRGPGRVGAQWTRRAGDRREIALRREREAGDVPRPARVEHVYEMTEIVTLIGMAPPERPCSQS